MTTEDDSSDRPGNATRLPAPPAATTPSAGRRPGETWQVLRREDAVRRVAIVLLISVPALTLRLWALDGLGLNSDEAVYAGQGASLAGDAEFLPYFPVFRAHPLIFQSLLSLQYRISGVSPLGGRLLAVAFGMGTVWLTYAIGTRLYGRRVGVLAALLIGVMPYPVVVDRQILLDGPMAFFAALGLYFLVRFVQSDQVAWVYAAAVAMGLATLTKETAVLLLGGVYAFFALTRKTRLRLVQMLIASALFVLTVLPYPISLKIAGSSSTGGAFLTWQLLRQANHPWWFYATTVPAALGFAVVAVAVVGLLVMHRSLTWAEHLLLAWIAVPCLFFTVWSVKGFQYLLPIAVPVAVLAAMVVVSVPLPSIRWRAGAVAITTAGLRTAAAAALVVDPRRHVLVPHPAGRCGVQLPGGHGRRPRRARSRTVGGRQHPRGIADARPRPVDGQHHPVLRPPQGLRALGEPRIRCTAIPSTTPSTTRICRSGTASCSIWSGTPSPRPAPRSSPSGWRRTPSAITAGSSIRSSSRCGPSRAWCRNRSSRSTRCGRDAARGRRPGRARARRSSPWPPRPPPPLTSRVPAEELSTSTPIKHFVVLMQENHSFDNYFGTYPGADGIPEGACMPVDPATIPTAAASSPFHARRSGDRRPGPQRGRLRQPSPTAGGWTGSSPALDDRRRVGDQAMGYYDDRDLPFYWNVADDYVLFDRFFTSAAGGSIWNHMYWVTGTPGNPESDTLLDRPASTTCRRSSTGSQEAGISWKFYVQNYDPSQLPHVPASGRRRVPGRSGCRC